MSDLQRPFLDKVLSSHAFKRSPRLKRFLRYLAERILSGQAGSVKEYVLGVEVFDRPDTFDPRFDPIVRVEAGRLRAKLQFYYEGEGALDEWRLMMPLGGYQLAFQLMEPRLPAPVPRSADIFIRVLPILANEPNQRSQYFAKGLTEEVAFQLGRHENLRIASLASIHIGDGIDYLVEGSVRREKRRARLLLHLVETARGIRVWSADYEGDVESAWVAQKAFSRLFADDVAGLQERGILSSFGRNSRSHTRILDLYQTGRRHLEKRTGTGIRQGIRCFQQLIASERESALGYAGLADGYSLGARYDILPPRQSWMKALSAATSAIRLDDSLAEAHATLAFVHLHYGRDWTRARREFLIALDLDPRYPLARRWYGWYLLASGQADAGVKSFEQAYQADPHSTNASADLAQALYFVRDYQGCVRQCEVTLQMASDCYRAQQLLGLCALQTHDYQSAAGHFHATIRAAGRTGRRLALLCHAYTGLGDDGRRMEVTDQFRSDIAASSAIDQALLHAAAGEHRLMFSALHRAFDDHDGELIWLPQDPIYDELRHDKRFIHLTERIQSGQG